MVGAHPGPSPDLNGRKGYIFQCYRLKGVSPFLSDIVVCVSLGRSCFTAPSYPVIIIISLTQGCTIAGQAQN